MKIGVVPFTANVNVGTTYANAAWIDNTNRANSMSQENIAVQTGTGLITFASTFAKATGQSSWAWAGCVRQRTEPYDLQDVAPSASNPATLFTPLFAPDEPDANQNCSSNYNYYVNSYLCDQTCWKGTTNANLEADQSCTAKYTSSPKLVTNTNGIGPNRLCTIQPIIRLSNNPSPILNEINAMQAYGSTVIPAGLMWGWHLLSPNGPFGDGVAYTDTSTIKAIILVTDGQNEVSLGNLNGSYYNAYGYAYVNGQPSHLASLTSGTSDVADYNLDQKEAQLCNNIKAVTDAYGQPGRIKLYAIGFGNVINSNSLQLLSQCASSSANYFYNPTSQALISTFQSIAIGLNQLRIAQ